MKPPFEAYRGTEPYLFISYAHKDSEIVFQQITQWHNEGYRIWYDEGIDPGNEWPDEIAAALEACSQFIVFITSRSVESKNVKNEINFALNLDKEFIAIHLEETELSSGLQLRMGDIQAIMKYRMTEEMFVNKMSKSLLKKVQGKVPSKPVELSGNETGESPGMSGLSPKRGNGHTGLGVFFNIASDALSTIKETAEDMADTRDLRLKLKETFDQKKHDYEEMVTESRRSKKSGKKNQRTNHSQNRQNDVERPKTTVKKVKTGCLSTILSFVLIAGGGYYIYFHVLNRYSTLTRDYLKTECPGYRVKRAKLNFLGSLKKLNDEDRAMVELEDELEKCSRNTPVSLAMKKLRVEEMSIDTLEKLYLKREHKTTSWKKELIKEYREKYRTEVEEKVGRTKSSTVRSLVSEQYRKLLIEMIRSTYEN